MTQQQRRDSDDDEEKTDDLIDAVLEYVIGDGDDDD